MQNINRKLGGIVLIVVLGVLALMSVLAITFVSMTRLERSISRNYVDHTRAVMVTESGIEYAIKRIANFRGGVNTTEEMAAMQYQDGDYTVLLENADRPSFQMPGKPYSGVVSSTHARNSDRFKLKVADLSGRINLNDSNEELNLPQPPYDTGQISYGTRRLSLMISYLCELLFADTLGVGIGDAVAGRIESAKNAKGRFTSMDEIKTILYEEVGFGPVEWRQFQQYFTIYGWQDKNVLRPTFKVDISVPDGVDPAPVYDDGGADVYLYLDMQTKKFALDKRSPVNINLAPKETIQMLFALVSGWYLKEGPGEDLSDGHYGKWKITHNFGGDAFYYYYSDENIKSGDGVTCLEKQNTFGLITRTIHLGDPISPSYDPARLTAIGDFTWDRIHTLNNPFETWDPRTGN
ncbi:PilX N-terminal domain-containing pilus assembly protein [Planctomycetota bacterium]